MPAITINGVTIPTFKDSISEEYVVIGSDSTERGANGTLMGSESIEKRRWSFTTTPIVPSLFRPLKAWINGHFLTWRFGPHAQLASTGLRNAAAVTATPFDTGGPTGPRILVSSGGLLRYDLRRFVWMPKGWLPSDGYSLGFFKLDDVAAGDTGATSGWNDYVVSRQKTSSGGEIIRGTAPDGLVRQYLKGVLGSYDMHQYVNVQGEGNNVAITGHRRNGASNAVSYAQMLFCPFQIPESWLVDLSNFRSAFTLPASPYVFLGGDLVGDDQPVLVRCRTRSASQQGGVINGVFTPALRWLEVECEEV